MNQSYYRTLIVALFLGFTTSLNAQIAPNITVTDLDGIEHELYAYLDSGYQVILDFSYEFCGPCYDWSVNVGHALWDNYGPDGENILRMLHIDTDEFASDNNVASYTQSWGVEYPVVNLQGTHPSYPVDGFPALFYICPDKLLHEWGGYGYPSSQIAAQYFIDKCQGIDLSSNYSFFSASEASSSSLCSSSLLYSPSIIVVQSSGVENLWSNDFFDTEYEVEIYINGVYHSTQVLDPAADGIIGTLEDENVLEPFPVNLNDEVTLVLNVENDNYPDDDTIHVTIPSSVNTETSTDVTLAVETNSAVFYYVYDSNNEFIHDGDGNSEFDLEPDACYSIVFYNAHVYPAVLKDVASGSTLCSYQVGDYVSLETPKLYFNVVKSVDIEEVYFDTNIKDSYYLDLLGKRFETNDQSHLIQGVYLKVTEYKNGDKTVKKVLRSNL